MADDAADRVTAFAEILEGKDYDTLTAEEIAQLAVKYLAPQTFADAVRESRVFWRRQLVHDMILAQIALVKENCQIHQVMERTQFPAWIVEFADATTQALAGVEARDVPGAETA